MPTFKVTKDPTRVVSAQSAEGPRRLRRLRLHAEGVGRERARCYEEFSKKRGKSFECENRWLSSLATDRVIDALRLARCRAWKTVESSTRKGGGSYA